MKLQAIIIFLILMGCSGNKAELENTSEIYAEAKVLLDANKGFNNSISLKKSGLSTMVEFTKAYTTELGLYLVQGESFASEYGLFIPREDKGLAVNDSSDPSYVLIANHVYRYKVEG